MVKLTWNINCIFERNCFAFIPLFSCYKLKKDHLKFWWNQYHVDPKSKNELVTKACWKNFMLWKGLSYIIHAYFFIRNKLALLCSIYLFWQYSKKNTLSWKPMWWKVNILIATKAHFSLVIKQFRVCYMAINWKDMHCHQK